MTARVRTQFGAARPAGPCNEGRRRGPWWSLFAFSLALSGLAGAASAHPEGFSGLRVSVTPTEVRAVLTLHTRDLSAWFPPGRYNDYAADVAAALAREPGELLEVRADGQAAAPRNVRGSVPETGLIQIDLEYPIAPGASSLEVWSKHLVRMPRGHQQLLVVTGVADERTDPAAGPVLLDATLDVEQDSADVALPPRHAGTGAAAAPSGSPGGAQTPSTSPAAAASRPGFDGDPAPPRRPPRRTSFFLLGVEHILAGYDHLLFLAALLLVCERFREAAAIVTSFTLAHSITLALAALDLVRLSPAVVEPAIATSIVYVGVENLFGGRRVAWRTGVTFAFGLVHGLGFAEVLRGLGLASTPGGAALPLLKFNLGVEVGQLCVTALLLPLFLLLKRYPALHRRGVPACSVLVAVVGAVWLVTRLTGR